MEDKTLTWDKETEAKFNLMINKMPLFHRRIAESVAKAAAEENARKRNSKLVQEEDVVRAFFRRGPQAILQYDD